MRTKNSILNIFSGIFIKFITLLCTFISRTIFIQVLGVVYLGFNGVMTNVFMLLSIAELGIGTAIAYSLYKPLAVNDTNKVVALMQLYKKAYRIIGVIVLGFGLILMPIIVTFVDEVKHIENYFIVYLVFLLQIVVPYFINYKVLLLIANQKEYKLTKINVAFSIINIGIQVGVLLAFESYFIYLTGILIINILQILFVNNMVDKAFPYLNTVEKIKLEKVDLDEIKKNIKAMFFHKIGDFSINGTDNLIISFFISLTMIGLYSNYSMLILSINGFILVFFNSMTASMGNLIATSDETKRKEIFEVANFIGFVFYSVATVCFFNLLDITINLWLGEEFLLSTEVVVVLLVNFYLTGMRVPLGMIKNAAGLYDVDKYSPLIQAAINLVLSIILVQQWGLFGVFLGTAISSIVLPCWQRPYLIYKYVFKSSSVSYFIKYFIQIATVLLMAFTTISINNYLFIEPNFMNLLGNLFVTVIISSIILVVFFFKTKEVKFILTKFIRR